jgi:hypothetical protein
LRDQGYEIVRLESEAADLEPDGDDEAAYDDGFNAPAID